MNHASDRANIQQIAISHARHCEGTMTREIYSIPEVAQACERAQRRANDSGEDWCVYVQQFESGNVRTFTSPSSDPACPGVLVFDTADGGRLT